MSDEKSPILPLVVLGLLVSGAWVVADARAKESAKPRSKYTENGRRRRRYR